VRKLSLFRAALVGALAVSVFVAAEPPPEEGMGAALAASAANPTGRLSLQALAFYASSPGASRALAIEHEPARQPFVWPADGAISQPFAYNHIGLDIAVGTGAEVRAARDGIVAFAGGGTGHEYGYFVILAHDQGWSTLYAHLSSIAVVQGALVPQGQVIGRSGDTGKAEGPHLHFELRSGGAPVDPYPHLPPGRALPPPVLVVEGRSPQEANAAAAPQRPTPAPTPGSSAEVAAVALGWLNGQPALAGTIDSAACAPGRLGGSQWIVTCPPSGGGSVVLICVDAAPPRTIWLC
jgi:hypothetical protein